MLLLNFVRAVILFLALLLTHTFQIAYSLDGVALIGVASAVAFVGFFIADLAGTALVEAFNPEPKRRTP